MNKKELIEFLDKYSNNTEIWLSRDEEGNGFKPLYKPEEFIEDHGDFFKEDWGAHGACLEEEHFQKLVKEGKRVLIFFP